MFCNPFRIPSTYAHVWLALPQKGFGTNRSINVLHITTENGFLRLGNFKEVHPLRMDLFQNSFNPRLMKRGDYQ
jgi:hypothetical protein